VTKISRGQRAHLLALYTPPGTITFTLRNRVTGPAKRAARALKNLARASQKGGAAFVVMSGAVSAYERTTMGMHHAVAMAVLGKVYP
jgi:hypothetical protein